jgi:hypothetical protein
MQTEPEEKDWVTMGPRPRDPNDGAAKPMKRTLPMDAQNVLKPAILRDQTQRCIKIRVKLKACPERGSYKSQANDLHGSCPNAHRPKHDRLFSRRKQRRRNQQCSTNERTIGESFRDTQTEDSCTSPAQGVRRECSRPAHAEKGTRRNHRG